jgi:hypothetical protein
LREQWVHERQSRDEEQNKQSHSGNTISLPP